jgi:hypothetical protein
MSGKAAQMTAAVPRVASQSQPAIHINSVTVRAEAKLPNRAIFVVIAPHHQPADVAVQRADQATCSFWFSQLMRDCPHPGFEAFSCFIRLLLQSGTTDHDRLAWHVGRLLFRNGVNKDAKYNPYPISFFLAKASIAN